MALMIKTVGTRKYTTVGANIELKSAHNNPTKNKYYGRNKKIGKTIEKCQIV